MMAMPVRLELTEDIVKHIHLDAEAYWDFDGDEVVYAIAPTDALITYADMTRYFLGFKPCFKDYGTGMDMDGYYDFYMVADKNRLKEFYFVASVSDKDDWGEYDIPMIDELRGMLYDRLNELSAKWCGGTARELIELNEMEG